jgi:two-component system, NarL family, sensor histidine kinase LiaS
MNKSTATMSKKQSKSPSYPRRSPPLRGLQARMTFSYVWVTALFVLLLEILAVALYLFLINIQAETSNLALAQRVCVQYAYAASVQSNGLVLNPRTTFQPGQPYSLIPLGTRTPGENARLNFDLSNYTIPYIAENNPAQPPPAIGLVIAPNGRIVASSFPAHYPTNMLFTQLLPHQSTAVAHAMRGNSIYAKTQPHEPDLLYVAETIWGKHEQPIGVFYAQAPEEPLSYTDVLQSAYSNWLFLVIVILLVLVVTTPIGSLFSLLTTRGLVRRIRRLADATTSFANGDFHQRVPVSRLDEVGRLEYDFNQMANQLVESTNRQQELAGQNARLAERTRISRELHDAISQDLFSLRMLAYGLQDALPKSSEVQKQAATLEGTTSRMIREMRALLLELRPAQLEQLGLAEALKDLAASYGERLGMTVTADIVPVSLPPEAENALLRVTQEALSNAARHAHATHVTLTLAQTEEGVCLTIRDDGEGFEWDNSQKQYGLGLHSMQERVREQHGTFTLNSSPGQGTEITVCIPQKEKE